jgi:hypothetical protein
MAPRCGDHGKYVLGGGAGYEMQASKWMWIQGESKAVKELKGGFRYDTTSCRRSGNLVQGGWVSDSQGGSQFFDTIMGP